MAGATGNTSQQEEPASLLKTLTLPEGDVREFTLRAGALRVSHAY